MWRKTERDRERQRDRETEASYYHLASFSYGDMQARDTVRIVDVI